ncbi:MAG: hypothetical protein ABSF09_07890 [Candidatus Bathyarchaeia archaeon]
MQYSQLLLWWAISISWSAAFLIAVSFYLYLRRKNRMADKTSSHIRSTDFVFVMVLTGLLGLYIISIDLASSLLFALGNIVVEVILLVYTERKQTAST